VEVEEVNHVFKLSQNRDSESYANIISRLQRGDADAQTIAAEMQQRQSYLFTEK
jgi:transcriptional regulator